MTYYKTPIDYQNGRISQDVEKVNENFTELAKSFVNDDPTTYTVVNSDKVDNYHASQTPSANTIPVSDDSGKINVNWIQQGSGSGLNADQVDGFHANQTPAPNTIPVSGTDGKLNLGWIPQGSNSGLDADLLDGVDESKFVRTDIARTITAQHTFNTPTAGAPFILGNNTQGRLVEGLNADLLDGFNASQISSPNTIPVANNSGKIDLNWIPQGSGSGLNADQVDGFHASQTPTSNTIPVSGTDGKLNVEWLPSNINADTVDNFHASQTSSPNTIPVSGSDGRLALDWLPQGHNSGLNADRLDNIEESQFVRTDEPRTITVQHTFNPSTAGAPFILGSNARGRLVTGLNADQVDGFDATQNPAGNQIPVTWGDGRLVVPNGFFYALQTPTNLTATAQSGGSLSGTYYYRVVAFGYAGGNSAPSSEVSVTLDGTTNGTAFLSWAPVVGAVRYRIYRGTSSGGQNQYVEVTGTTTLVDDGSLSWTAGTPPATAGFVTGINFNGVRIGGNFVSGGYIAQNIWQANTIGSQNGIGIPHNRLLGATSRYTITSSNIANVSRLFDGLYDSLANIPANTEGVVEIDFNPFIGWTPNTDSGFLYSDGLIVISFYSSNVATKIKVEAYRFNSSTNSDEWITLFYTEKNNFNPLIIPIPLFTYPRLKKLRFSFFNSSIPVWLTEIEYFPFRETISFFSCIPSAYTSAYDVYLPELRFRDTANNIQAYIRNTGEAKFNRPVHTITSNTTLTINHHYVFANASSGNITITLPPASSSRGREYVIKKIDSSSNSVIIDPNGNELIEGALTYSLTLQNQSVKIVCDGTQWWIVE